MRIVVDYRPALKTRTGVGEYVHELARALVRTGEDDITLFSASWSDRLSADAVPGAHVLDRRWPVRALNYAWHRLEWPPIEQVAGAVDVAQSLHPLLMPAHRAAQVVTIHDLDFLDHPERTSAEVRRDYPRLARSHAARADRVIVVSQFTADQVTAKLGVPADRITIASAGAPDWTPRATEPTAGYFLFLGTLEPRKNVGALLDAYTQLIADSPNAPRLVLAGRAAPGSEPWLARLAAPPLVGRVDLRGYVPPEARRALMEGALALVMPSLLEGFGIPVVEAMTLGVPVIASRAGSLPEVAGRAALFFDPRRPEELAAQMRTVSASADTRAALVAHGFAEVTRYQWSATAARTREAWHLACEARQRRAGFRG